jgi:hypothetical protein
MFLKDKVIITERRSLHFQIVRRPHLVYCDFLYSYIRCAYGKAVKETGTFVHLAELLYFTLSVPISTRYIPAWFASLNTFQEFLKLFFYLGIPATQSDCPG